MKKVVLIHGNPINPDSRLEKEAATLCKNGYQVSLLGWNRWDMVPAFEQKAGYTISRFQLHAPTDVAVIFFWPIWWIYEFIWLMRHQWDIVHAADFDSYLPAVLAAKLKNKIVIYDIFDFLPDSAKLPSLIHNIFTKIDLYLLKFSNSIIIVDKYRLKQIQRENNPEGITIIYNTPEDVNINQRSHSTSRHHDKFKIFYGGTIIPERDILSVLRIVSENKDMELIVAGWGNTKLVETVKLYDKQYENISYIGGVPYEEIISHSLETDILFALYDPNIPNNKYSSPNKLFEAMMCGKPIIVNDDVTMADIVREEKCGIVVKYGDYESIKNAILLLKLNENLRKELGDNGRAAYEKTYNWNIMEDRLLSLYESLVKTKEET